MTADSTFPGGFRYLRMVSRPARRFLAPRGEAVYEVMVEPGEIARVTLADLPQTLGATGESRRDWQECELRARKLFGTGSALWVEYPTGIEVDDTAIGEAGSGH
jgi:hypothetical protein